MTVTNDIKYVGVNDRRIDLFEGQYRVPNGISYNSYVILDEKIAVMDTVDERKTTEWFDNLEKFWQEKSLIIWWFCIWNQIMQLILKSF